MGTAAPITTQLEQDLVPLSKPEAGKISLPATIPPIPHPVEGDYDDDDDDGNDHSVKGEEQQEQQKEEEEEEHGDGLEHLVDETASLPKPEIPEAEDISEIRALQPAVSLDSAPAESDPLIGRNIDVHSAAGTNPLESNEEGELEKLAPTDPNNVDASDFEDKGVEGPGDEPFVCGTEPTPPSNSSSQTPLEKPGSTATTSINSNLRFPTGTSEDEPTLKSRAKEQDVPTQKRNKIFIGLIVLLLLLVIILTFISRLSEN